MPNQNRSPKTILTTLTVRIPETVDEKSHDEILDEYIAMVLYAELCKTANRRDERVSPTAAVALH